MSEPLVGPHRTGTSGKPATAPAEPLLARRTALALATTKRPRDHPRSLTPQFHWNLNDSALRSLSDDDRAALYQLFRFYDSSFQGDALPAIHLPRFLELLRDAHLLASDDGDGRDDDELQVHTVERVFAEAVLGKLRTYLDAEDEPALPFQLFSGALFHCAMIKFPELAPPELAFRRVVEMLLTLQPRGGSTVPDPARGLVGHAEQAAIPSWRVEDLHHHHHHIDDPDVASTVEPPKLFLEREVFQQVVAGLSLDKVVDEQRRERLEELYVVPEEITSHFNADTIRFITERFRTFDVFDRGVLPRDEVFALLSGMAKKLEITDVYEVLAVILAGEIGDRKQLPRGSLVLTAPSKITHVSLAQVIHALHICRRARTASYHLGVQNQNRKVGGVAAAPAKQAQNANETTETTDAASKITGKKGTHGIRTAKAADKKAPAKGKGSSNATGTTSSPHKSQSPTKSSSKMTAPPSQPSAAAATTKRAGVAKPKERKPTASVSGSSADPGLVRRLSKMSASSSEASSLHTTHVSEDDGRRAPTIASDPEAAARQDSFRSASSSSSAHTGSVKYGVDGSLTFLPTVTVTSGATQLVQHHQDHSATSREELELPRVVSMPHEPPPVLTLRMFHTHSDDPPRPAFAKYDGAICLTIQLFLAPPPSRIVSSQGVHFAANGERDEVWSTETRVLDAKLPPEAAVVALKKIVDDKRHVGFELVPDVEQREAIDSLVRELRDAKCPRYAAALHSPAKTNHVEKDAAREHHGLRRDGVAVRPSLDRGGTWVRDPPTDDPFGELSDSQAYKHLRATRRQAKRLDHTRQRSPAAASLVQAPGSPTVRRPCEVPPHELQYDQIVHSLGLDHVEGAWVSALNPRCERGLRSSQSLPLLGGPRPSTGATANPLG